MNPRALLKSLLMVVVLLGVAWLWWESTAPNVPVEPAAPASSPAKPSIVSVSAPMSLSEQVAMTAPTANIDDSATPNTTTPSESPDSIYALAHRGDPSLPDSAYLPVPLDQAEHHIFRRGTTEVSVEAYYHDGQGTEWVQFHDWQYILPSGAIIPRNGEGWERVASFSIAEQDYIRNWAKQQVAAAAAAANAPAAPQVSSEPEPPARPTTQVQQRPLVITN